MNPSNFYRTVCLICLPVVLGCSASPLAAQTAPSSLAMPQSATVDRAAISRFVDDFFEREMAELQVPGAAFAMVTAGEGGDSEVLVLRGYGYADLDAQTIMDPQRTVVRVGSVSKPVTALAALQLVHRGQLDLHGDINDVLGHDLVPDTFEQPVSLFHLLSQTAGFGERLFGQHTLRAEDHLPLRIFLERHLTRRIRPPGLVINYNDYQTSLAGLMVETVSQASFPEAARQLVFEPLGMASSTFEQVALPSDLEARLAVAYRSGPVAHERDYVHTTPAAGLYTTTADMARFVGALLTGTSQADISWAAEEMKRTQFRHGPYMPGRGFGLAEGSSHGYRTLHKDGQCSGFTARIVLVPELGVGWFSVQNLSIFGRAGAIGRVNGLHRRLASELVAEFWPAGPDYDAPPSTLVAAADESPDEQVTVELETVELQATSRLAGAYRETMDPTEGWEGLLLDNEVAVEAGPGGTVRFFGRDWQRAATDDGSKTFLHRSASHDGHDSIELARFISSTETGQSWLTFGGGSWERVPWYRSATFVRVTLAACVLFLALAVPVFLWQRRRPERLLPGARALAGSATLFVLFALGLGTAMWITDVQALYSGVTPLLRLVLLLPPLALILSVLGLTQLAVGWRRDGETTQTLARLYWSAVAAAAVTTSTVLYLNHALGWPL